MFCPVFLNNGSMYLLKWIEFLERRENINFVKGSEGTKVDLS